MGPHEQLRADLAALPGRAELDRSGQLQLRTWAELTGSGGDLAPVAVEVDRAIGAALAAGFTGLCLITELSPLVRMHGAPAALGLEMAVECVVAAAPACLLCAYQDIGLPGATWLDVRRAHPTDDGDGVGPDFRVYGSTRELVLQGEIDAFTAGDLDRLLAARPDGPVRSIDLSEVQFIDHHGLQTLAGRSLSGLGDAPVVLTGVPHYVRRLWTTLGLPDERVELVER